MKAGVLTNYVGHIGFWRQNSGPHRLLFSCEEPGKEEKTKLMARLLCVAVLTCVLFYSHQFQSSGYHAISFDKRSISEPFLSSGKHVSGRVVRIFPYNYYNFTVWYDEGGGKSPEHRWFLGF